MSDGRRKQKPLSPVKVGSVAIERYQLGDGRIMISWRDAGGARKLRTFAKAAKAREEAETIARDLHNGGAEAAIFSAADRASYSQAAKGVAAFGVPVHVATSEWAELRKSAGALTQSLSEIFAAGLKVMRRTPHLVGDVVRELLAGKGERDLHGRYSRGMKTTLEAFALAFPGDISSVTPVQIEEYLRDLKKEPRRRDNILKEIRHLFRFAWRRKYLPEELTAAKQVDLIDAPAGAITYFTPEEIQLFLEHVAEEWRDFLVLAAFSGVRSEEICLARDAKRGKDPLRWEDFDWDEREICVRSETAKTGVPRRAPIVDNLWAWLAPHRDRHSSGHVCPGRNRPDIEFSDDGRLLRVINRSRAKDTKAGYFPGLEPKAPERIRWRNDGLRHSYGSYRMAILRDMGKLSYEMGNSIAIIKRNYHNPRPAKQAKAYFGLAPAAPLENVIQLPLLA